MATAQGIRAGKAYVELSVREDVTSKIKGKLDSLSSKLDAFSKSASQKIADAFAIGAPLGMATKLFADFDDQMRIVAAVSGTTGKAFDKLTERALELGRTTSFTASQVAQGMAGLGRAGFNSTEIDTAISSVMALSKATATELSVATDIAGNALRAFGLNASEMSRVCDVLAVTANGSAQTVDDLGEALKFVAPIAAQTGMTLEDTAKVLGTLANFGIKGSNAGTAFKNMRVKMADPTVQKQYESIGVDVIDKDTGALRNLSDVLNDLRVAVQNMPDAERLSLFKDLFGMYGLAGGSVLATAEGFDELYAAIDNASGAAERTQEAMEAGLGGTIRSTLSAVEGLAIAVGDALTPTVRDLGETIKKVSARVTEWSSSHRPLINFLAKTSVKTLAIGVASLVAARAIARIVAALKFGVTVFRTAGAVLGFLSGATKALTAAQAANATVSIASANVKAAEAAIVAASTAADKFAAIAAYNVAAAEEAKAVAAQKATAAIAMQKIAMASMIVVAAGFAAAAAGVAYMTATAEKGVQKAKELAQATQQRAQANESARQKDAELFEELQNLAEQGELTNEEFARGKMIIAELTSKYGDLGISIDEVAKKFGIAAEAKAAFDAKMREAQRKDVEAQIAALENENKEIDKAIGKYTNDGFRSMAINYGREIGSWFGADTASERVESLGNEKAANIKELQALRQQLEGLKDLDEAVKQDQEDVASGKNVAGVREAVQSSAEFEQKLNSQGKFETRREPIEADYKKYVDAQTKIRDAGLASAQTDEERQTIRDTYNANVAKATEWRNRNVGEINAEEARAKSESERTLALSDAQMKVLSAKLTNPEQLADAAQALKDVEEENAKSYANEAMQRLADAATALRAAQESGNAAQLEAAQKELADAQQEASNASSALEDALAQPLKEVSSGTFDAFEAFDMTNDWEKEEMEKQTETLAAINETLKMVRKNQEDGVRDENGIVVI